MSYNAQHTSDSGPFRALSKHEKYFLNGGDLYFLIEHVHFRVHRYFFERESPFFQSRLCTPASPGAARQGSTEATAIVLDDLRSDDFAKFLWVFYNPKYSLYKTTPADWKIILRLAHLWQFQEVKNLVVRELEKLELVDVDRIATYHRYDVDRRLLIPRYAALCEREEPLTLHEGLELGLETTLMIARAREYARGPSKDNGPRSPTAAGMEVNEMHSLIQTLFDIRPLEESEKNVEEPAPDIAGITTSEKSAKADAAAAGSRGANGQAQTNGTQANGTRPAGGAAPNGAGASGGVAANGAPVGAGSGAEKDPLKGGQANGVGNGIAGGNSSLDAEADDVFGGRSTPTGGRGRGANGNKNQNRGAPVGRGAGRQ